MRHFINEWKGLSKKIAKTDTKRNDYGQENCSKKKRGEKKLSYNIYFLSLAFLVSLFNNLMNVIITQ